jgi:DNA-binding Lrp family transcriptional regulator
MTTAIVLIDVDRSEMANFGPLLADVEGVAEAHSVGGEWDFVAIVRVAKSENLAGVVSGEIGGLPGVIRTHTLVGLQAF